MQPIAISEAVEGTGTFQLTHAKPSQQGCLTDFVLSGDLCGGIFIDETVEEMCKSRLGDKWTRLSKAGIKEVMRGDWERHIKPQFKDPNSQKEYIVRVPAEAFKGESEHDDTTKEPLIKSGRIHFTG